MRRERQLFRRTDRLRRPGRPNARGDFGRHGIGGSILDDGHFPEVHDVGADRVRILILIPPKTKHLGEAKLPVGVPKQHQVADLRLLGEGPNGVL